MTDQRLPLDGIRVLEFGHIAAGPFASLVLADLGADVVKVEPPTGDAMRSWPPFVNDAGDQVSLSFLALNRNKNSIRADLKDSDQFADVRRLCLLADVIIENYRPGSMNKLGLGFESLRDDHPGMVYCSISGFGHTGPHRERAAFDVVVQAMSGLMSVTGEGARAPVKCGVPVGDFVAGLYAALTIVAHVPRVRAGGLSVHIDCSMLDCLLGISGLQTSEFWGTCESPGRHGSAHSRNAPYQVFQTRDRPLAIAAGTPKLWEATCRAVGRPELIDDERFYDQVARVRNQVDLVEELESALKAQDCSDWERRFDDSGVPCGPVNTYEEILRSDHVRARDLVEALRLPSGEATPALRFPLKISGQDPRPSTANILAESTTVQQIHDAWERESA